MPICPGCERNVSYQELDLHERYCRGKFGGGASASGSRECLKRKITYMEERLEEEVADIEREFERRLARTRRRGDPCKGIHR